MAYDSDASVDIGAAEAKQPAATRSQRGRLPRVKETAAIVYLTMAILLVSNPRPVSEWLADLPQNRITEAAKAAADIIAEWSERFGLSAAHDEARAGFLKSVARDRGQGRR